MFAISFHPGNFDHLVNLELGNVYHVGDLIIGDSSYYLILDLEVHPDTPYLTIFNHQLIQHKLLSERSVQMIIWMVSYRYSSYYKVLPLRLCSLDRDILQKYHSISQKKKPKPSYHPYQYIDHHIVQSPDLCQGQQLIVFPDLWTLETMISHPLDKQTKILYSSITSKQKIEIFRAIKQGHLHTLICTYSQIFQDRHSLSHILIIDPHKRYYKNKQNPRYHTYKVLQYMSDLYQCPLSLGSVFPLSSSLAGSSGG